MFKLGEKQVLKIANETTFGVYLKENGNEEDVLLPRKQVPEGANIGDEVEVFIYKDSKDRLIATTKTPKITLGEMAVLNVIDTNKIGAFLDWGLEKDLFLPFKEQTIKVKKGKKYLVSLYIDKSERLSATMKVYSNLIGKSPYSLNDAISGIVYEINNDMGAFVAIDLKYHGFIPKHELIGEHSVGDFIEGRISSIRDDGKANITLTEKAYKKMDKDVELILEQLEKQEGRLFLTDKSSPQEIHNKLGISKNAFKRAVGRLLKQGKIILNKDNIELKV